MDAFIDFCILCGCDYCGTVRGVGPATGFKLLKQHGTLEAAVASLDRHNHTSAEYARTVSVSKSESEASKAGSGCMHSRHARSTIR